MPPLDPRFTAATFLRGLDDVIAKPFRYEISADVERAFRESSGAEKLPFEAIEALLNHLCGERILSREGSHYGYSYEYARKVSNERAAQAETQMRQRAVDRAMRRIMFAIRADPQGAFDIEHWKRAPIPPFGTTLDALIDTEHGMWQRFETALSAIETMVDGGKPVQETLGLPIDAAIDRANAAEKARLAVGADDRIEHLRARAEYHLGPDAEIWLEAKGASGVSPLDAARAGVPSMETLLSQVGEAGRERILRLRVEAERRKLSDAAERVLGVRTAAFFLDNMEPKLGMSPRKFCKDAVTRARCMVMLEEWVARDKRNRRR